MKTESIKELTELCRAGKCTISLEGNQSGVVAQVTVNRGEVTKTTSMYLDFNDPEVGARLEAAVQRVQ